MTSVAFADEQVRQVQEELRRRHLYFGDIDGRSTPELASALKRYQERKGFPPTGQIDQSTASSLSVQIATLTVGDGIKLPDVTILKSDRAPELPQEKRIALEKESEQNPDAMPSPAPPAEEPPPSQDLTPARVTQFVEQYLQDGEGDDIAAQTRYFAYPVEYFGHGTVGADFVRKDVSNYVRHLPERKYMLTDPVSFVAGTNEGETKVEFVIAFAVKNSKISAKGRTRNFWTIRPEGDELKIVSIREQRLRDEK